MCLFIRMNLFERHIGVLLDLFQISLHCATNVFALLFLPMNRVEALSNKEEGGDLKEENETER